MQIKSDIFRKEYLQREAEKRYIANRETILKVVKEYFHMKKHLNVTCDCPCCGHFSQQNKQTHIQPKMHLKDELYVLECTKDEEILYNVK